MWARLQLRISWRDLLSGAFFCVFPGDRARAQAAVEGYWGSDEVLSAYAVRSGFDLLLQALELEEGDEVVMSALNVKVMVNAVKRLGLTPVPVDIDLDTLGPRIEALEKAISPRAKVLVVAHLLGTRLTDLEPLFALARRHGLVIVEDCAQAFDGRDYPGHPMADVSMFSFGPIKVATALGGALVRVRDSALRDRMRRIRDGYPVQSNAAQFRRVLQFAALKMAMSRPAMALIQRLFASRGHHYNDALGNRARAVAPLKSAAKIRRQPSTAMLRLLARRIENYRHDDQEAFAEKGRRLAGLIGDAATLPGQASAIHNYWMFAAMVEEPEHLIEGLRAKGFDAAMLARAPAIEPPSDRPWLEPVAAKQVFEQVTLLPCYPSMPDAEIVREAEAVREIAGEMRPAAQPAPQPGPRMARV